MNKVFLTLIAVSVIVFAFCAPIWGVPRPVPECSTDQDCIDKYGAGYTCCPVPWPPYKICRYTPPLFMPIGLWF